MTGLSECGFDWLFDMYTVSKGSSKIINRTRHGISQKLEGLDTVRELTRKSSPDSSPPSSPDISSPRPVFSRRCHHSASDKHRGSCSSHHASGTPPAPRLSPQHEQLVLFLRHTWRRVEQEYEQTQENSGKDMRAAYYKETSTHPDLEGFQPFNLEAWLGLRLYEQLTSTT